MTLAEDIVIVLVYLGCMLLCLASYYGVAIPRKRPGLYIIKKWRFQAKILLASGAGLLCAGAILWFIDSFSSSGQG